MSEDRPTVILARTRKGRGFSEVEDRENWHGKPLPVEMAERAIANPAGIEEEILRPRVAAVAGRVGDVAVEVDVVLAIVDGVKPVAHVGAEEEAEAAIRPLARPRGSAGHARRGE